MNKPFTIDSGKIANRLSIRLIQALQSIAVGKTCDYYGDDMVLFNYGLIDKTVVTDLGRAVLAVIQKRKP